MCTDVVPSSTPRRCFAPFQLLLLLHHFTRPLACMKPSLRRGPPSILQDPRDGKMVQIANTIEVLLYLSHHAAHTETLEVSTRNAKSSNHPSSLDRQLSELRSARELRAYSTLADPKRLLAPRPNQYYLFSVPPFMDTPIKDASSAAHNLDTT